MKNNLYYPKVSLSDEDIFLEIKKEREEIGYYSLPHSDITNLKKELDSLNFKQKKYCNSWNWWKYFRYLCNIQFLKIP